MTMTNKDLKKSSSLIMLQLRLLGQTMSGLLQVTLLPAVMAEIVVMEVSQCQLP